MRISTIIMCLYLACPSFIQAQYMTDIPHPASKYYKEMFPPYIDEVKLLVLLPAQLMRKDIDSMIRNMSEAEKDKIYEFHLKTTQESIIKIQTYLKKYKINCEVTSKEAYTKDAYPISQYPLLVYPDSMVIDKYFVTFGYHIRDVAHNVDYGYVMGADPDYHDKYFKQLSSYVLKLKKRKAKMGANSEAALKAEAHIYKSQKINKKLINYVAFPLGFVAAIGGFLLILTNK